MKNDEKIPFVKSISGKLILVSSLVIFLAMAILTVIALLQMSSSINDEAMAKLEAIQNSRKIELSDLFTRTSKDSAVIADTQEMKEAIDHLILYHQEMNVSSTGNYDLTGEGGNLTRNYSDIYNEINANLQKYNDIYGYYDVFVLCAKHGHVMYTNTRESDLGENMSVGQYKDSGLGKLWRKVVKDKNTAIVDLEAYEPSNGIPAMFIGSPVFKDGEMTAVIALQINHENINKILNATTGMGESGESYIVGEDRLMRSESRFSKGGESTVLSLMVDTQASQVLDQSSSEPFSSIFKDYRGIDVLSVYSHMTIDEILNADFDWALIAEIDESEIMQPVYSLIVILVIIALVIIAIAILIMIFLSRSLSIPIKVAVDAAQQISTGDLKLTIENKYLERKDEIGLLAKALNQMINKLTEVVSVVLTGSEQIATASEQLSSGNQDLSNRTEQQATALEETSSAIEEMNSSIRSNADNTGSADQLSRDALEKTSDGSAAVSTMITSMNEISVSSNKIADIIEVINNIAFQTNLLALNASIEAARAGEQGKGFAVVAVEVRKLAKRSDKAASEIAEIIKTSNRKVDDGVEIANKAGDMLTEINGSVKKVTALVGEISAASQEQLSSVDQIDKTLSSLDENTQKNAALVEEAASSTEELSAQAEELNTNINFFKIDSISNVGRKSTQSNETRVRLLEEPKENKRDNKRDNKREKQDVSKEAYEVFTNLSDESEFAEF